jgi:hypothetical protein
LISYIDGLPDEDDPSVFGMNIYAEKLLRGNQADQLIASILSMEPHTRFSAMELVLCLKQFFFIVYNN